MIRNWVDLSLLAIFGTLWLYVTARFVVRGILRTIVEFEPSKEIEKQ